MLGLLREGRKNNSISNPGFKNFKTKNRFQKEAVFYNKKVMVRLGSPWHSFCFQKTADKKTWVRNNLAGAGLNPFLRSHAYRACRFRETKVRVFIPLKSLKLLADCFQGEQKIVKSIGWAILQLIITNKTCQALCFLAKFRRFYRN